MCEATENPIDFGIFHDLDIIVTRVAAGGVIIGPDSPLGRMYVVKNGVAAIRVQEITIEEVTHGGTFGEMGIVDPKPHSAQVIAVTDVDLYVINRAQFLQLVAATPEFALHVMRVLAGRLRGMNVRLQELLAFTF